MIKIKPITRVSLGLVFMTLSLVLAAVFIGITPDPSSSILEARKSVVEGLAVQLAALGRVNRNSDHKQVLARVVERNPEVMSAGVRSSSGALMAQAGNHEKQWVNVPLDHSTATHAQVPIYDGNERWATLEVQFSEMDTLSGGWLPSWLLKLLGFIAVSGFTGYWLFMRRTLRELDPSSVVPTRVKEAMDGLAEGVILVDEHAQTVLVNRSLCKWLGRNETELTARPPSAMQWIDPTTGRAPKSLPWHVALKSAEAQTGVVLCITTSNGDLRTFVVNASPILDANNRSRGALITLDDVTEVERKNSELQKALTSVEASKREIQKQNKALERLATRDPLTNCLNRRAFFEQFDALLKKARAADTPLSCIMTDIDHFKRINDSFGHATGDEVIKLVAGILQKTIREHDVLCRYGGEEFCIVLPGLETAQASSIAERLRALVEASARKEVTCGAKVTSSFGVASLDSRIAEPSDLVNRADEALYVAKEGGRNRVVCWQMDTETVAIGPSSPVVVNEIADRPAGPRHAEIVRLKKQVDDLERVLNKRTQALRHGEAHDRTTGLPNRLLFQDRVAQALARARRNGTNVAVLSLDIDTLRRVNNVLGRIYSEKLLAYVSERLMAATRDTDTIVVLDGDTGGPTLSRIGDNEFGLLIADMSTSQAVTWLVKRIFESLGESITLDEHEVFFNASVGVALYPNDGRTADALIMHAAAAREVAHQKLGRNSYQFYSSEINAQALKQIQLESQLRRALASDELSVHFQPKFSLRDGTLTGVEALMRWPHPELGMIPPSEFIPVAEQSGLITELGYWIMKRSSQWLKHWQQHGANDLKVAVNVSSIQFRDPGFVERVEHIIRESGVAASSLEVELTESTIMHNLDLATATITELSKRGIRISVDDFGTGYSSLSYLKAFPVHCLKIDRSFLLDLVTDATAETLVGTICVMAHKLGLTVVAEGVEEESQVRTLRRHRCDEVQGFLFAPPITGDEITELLEGGVESTPASKVLARRWPFRVPRLRRSG